MWIERQLTATLTDRVRSRPAVLLTGVRQTGKSSLLRKHFGQAHYVTFDNLNQVLSAQESPEHFLQNISGQCILDEIQYVPELLRYLKIAIDNDRERYGKWILTGSQQFEMMAEVSESLAGRVSILHLETLSAAELRNSPESDLQDFLWKGGYPELWSNPLIHSADFFESYMRTYIERDLKTLIDVKNLNDFRRFFKILASRIGQLLNYQDISKDAGVSDVTIRKWVHALEISGLVYLLPPFYANINKRLVKSPKIYFSDHGFAAYLLGITSSQDWNNHILKGNLWENLVLMEYIKNHSLIPGRDIFFYRDQNGVEIDFIIESSDKLFLVEAKSAERPAPEKLNFKKVAPLFQNRYQVECVAACTIPQNETMVLGSYVMHNPLLSTLQMH